MGKAKLVLKIEGMGCGHCLAAIENALRNVVGIASLKVTMGKVHVGCEADGPNATALTVAIEKAGFRLLSLK